MIIKWLEALRGGKYKQGHDYLLHNDLYSVFGVACDLLKNELLVEPIANGLMYNRCITGPPIHVINRLELSHQAANRLYVLNRVLTFEELACLIENFFLRITNDSLPESE